LVLGAADDQRQGIEMDVRVLWAVDVVSRRHGRFLISPRDTPGLNTLLRSVHYFPGYLLVRKHSTIAQPYSGSMLVSFSESTSGSSKCDAGTFLTRHENSTAVGRWLTDRGQSEEVCFSIKEAVSRFG
jgi:hypothetical protein